MSLLSVLLGLLLLGVVLYLAKNFQRQADKEFPYRKKETLLSPAERSFFGVLKGILGNDYHIASKVRLADVLQVKSGLPPAARQRAFNAISGKHVDFVICKTSDMSIKGAIELDDASHDKPQRMQRDLFVEKAFETSGLPLLRIKARGSYSTSETQGLLENSHIIEAKIVPARLPKSQEQVENARAPHTAKIESSEAAITTAPRLIPVCPKCGAALIEKVATKGRNAGQKYLGCSNFPHCRYAEKSN